MLIMISIKNLKPFILPVWQTLEQMSPYLLLGFLIAGVLSVLIPKEIVEKHLGGKGLWPIAKASLFGVPLPLCSCGVIPVSTSLRHHGASRAATVSFLLSTPQTGVDSIAVTFSLLGPIFAIFRPIAAFISGLLGGTAVAFLVAKEPTYHPQTKKCHKSCCASKKDSLVKRIFHYGFIILPRDIGRSLLVGILIAGAISVFVPNNFFSGNLGKGFIGMLLMMVFGIPLYVCATASVPVAAALILKGVSPGVALVFLMTGPATNAAAIATIYKLMGKSTTIVYLFSVTITALLSGLALDLLYSAKNIIIGPHIHTAFLPPIIKSISAILLLLIIGIAILSQYRQKHTHE